MARNRILIVEDDVSISKIIQKNLLSTGYAVFACFDGEEAKNILATDTDFDLALLDIMLPHLDGFELMDYLKHDNIPVIYLTAKADLESKIQGLRSGAEDYIVKPFEILELLVRIEKVLERTGKVSQILYASDLEINLLERSIRKNGVEIVLKPMEFDLLVMLAKNKNIALSRERLLHGVWGVDYIGETRTVDVHIGQLRKKLGLTNNIKTISKMGYRLED
ncbi:response regulator transcription factor [Bacillus niameyensis]|uniref:response regulator transcription factor n=1 Tax=Bacillus niameyensis TaxID=1522308 RepID=UPI00078501C1|nr:response regulator transcription factor [Bacillus niameyensis]